MLREFEHWFVKCDSKTQTGCFSNWWNTGSDRKAQNKKPQPPPRLNQIHLNDVTHKPQLQNIDDLWRKNNISVTHTHFNAPLER